jgi:hypothetical protein
MTAGLIAICCPRIAWAQAASATLGGVVRDETGAPIAEAQVVVRNKTNALERSVLTDKAGAFSESFLSPGAYDVTVRSPGFATAEIRDVALSINDQVTLAIRLTIQSQVESVKVVAEASRESVSPGVGTVVARQFVESMPLNGRSLHALLQLVPGVVLTSNSGSSTNGAQFAINGQRTTSNYFAVDGVSANTGMSTGIGVLQGQAGSGQTTGATALGGTNGLVSLDALEEFRIETSSFAPEFGRTPGGQVSLVTRRGQNAFHGIAAEYFRHDALDANDWFANSARQPQARERQYLFSGVLGGPLLSRRLFFFVSHESLRLTQPKAQRVAVPSEELRASAPLPLQPYLHAFPTPNGPSLGTGVAQFAASYTEPSSSDVSALRLDAQSGSRVNAFVRVSHAPSETTKRIGGLSTLSLTRVQADSVTTGATIVVGARTTADFRVGWAASHPSEFSSLDTFGGASIPAVRDVFLQGRSPSTAVSSFNLFGSSFDWGTGSTDSQRQINALASVAWLAGRHQLKFGLDYRRMRPTFSSNGSLSEFLYLTTPQQVAEARALVFQVTNSDAQARNGIFPSASAYVQDAWRAAKRLTLTYGLRVESVSPPTEASGRAPQALLGVEADLLQNPRLAPEGTPLWRDRAPSLAPRIGASYQLRASSNWESTVRAGAGLFYDIGLGNVATGFGSVYPFVASKFTLNVPLPIPDAAKAPPSLATDPPQQLWILDPQLRLPYTIEWNGSIEQNLGDMQAVVVSYVGASGRRLLVRQFYQQPLAEWPLSPVSIYVQRNLGHSSYKALQATYRRRLRQGFQVMSSYTLARSSDNASAADSSTPPATRTDVLAREWGPADFDVRHQFSTALTFEAPELSGNPVLRGLSSQLGVDLLLRIQSPLPFTPTTGLVAVPETGGVYVERPNIVAGQPLYIVNDALPGGRAANPAAFVAPPPNTQGDFPRNGLRAFWMSQIDLSIHRKFSLVAGTALEVKAELFNLLNHPNFGSPVSSLSDPLFGQPKQMLNNSLGGLNQLYQVGGPRSAEIAVRLSF